MTVAYDIVRNRYGGRCSLREKAKNWRIHFRVSDLQYKRMKANAEAEGYISISAYLRYLALERDQLIDERIIETNKYVKEIHAMLSKAKLKHYSVIR